MIRPLRGQCLVEMIAPPETIGTIHLPEVAVQPPQTEHGRDKIIEPRGPPYMGVVVAMGGWPLVRKGKYKGFQIPSDFKTGDTVIVHPRAGTRLERDLGERYRLISQRAVMAVVENTSPPSSDSPTPKEAAS